MMLLLWAWLTGAVLGAAATARNARKAARSSVPELASVWWIFGVPSALLWPLALLAMVIVGLCLSVAALAGVFARSGSLDPFWSSQGDFLSVDRSSS